MREFARAIGGQAPPGASGALAAAEVMRASASSIAEGGKSDQSLLQDIEQLGGKDDRGLEELNAYLADMSLDNNEKNGRRRVKGSEESGQSTERLIERPSADEWRKEETIERLRQREELARME